jgi:hypothetical protein
VSNVRKWLDNNILSNDIIVLIEPIGIVMQQFNAQKELNINDGTSIVGKLGISVALVNANPKTKLCTLHRH